MKKRINISLKKENKDQKTLFNKDVLQQNKEEDKKKDTNYFKRKEVFIPKKKKVENNFKKINIDLQENEIALCNIFIKDLKSKKTSKIEMVVSFKEGTIIDEYTEKKIKRITKFKEFILIDVEVLKKISFINQNKGYSEITLGDKDKRNKKTGTYE